MFATAWTIGRLGGVPIRLHISLLLIIPLIAWSLATHGLPGMARMIGVDPDAFILPPIVLGTLVALSIFVGVALHELGHALVARALGGRVRAITLMILGGVTDIEHDDSTPGQSFFVAAAGPAVSAGLALGGLFLAGRVTTPPDLQVGLLLFGWLNLYVAAFNLIPALPLDGGRILLAALRLKMPVERATRVAAIIGRAFGVAGMAFGVMTGQLMLALIGGFVYVAAGAEASGVEAREALRPLTARQAMTAAFVLVGPGTDLRTVAHLMLFHGAEAAVVRSGDEVAGVLLPDDLLPTRGEVAARLRSPPMVAAADAPLLEVAKALSRHRRSGGVVVIGQNDLVLGVITREQLSRVIALARAAAAPERR